MVLYLLVVSYLGNTSYFFNKYNSIGSESMLSTQTNFISRWFKGKELALAIALSLNISNIGSIITGYASPAIYESGTGGKLGLAFMVGFLITLLALIATIFLGIIIHFHHDYSISR